MQRWLGGRDSNPDTQIQSLISPVDFKQNQQLNSANRGRVRQNPQRRRNKKNTTGHPRLPEGQDLRIENTLTDEHGDDVKLKKGTHVDVTVTVEPKT
jgi:hypothetical protein